eukprot:TRINITY_DN67517_c2_g2_i1.p1 TRINITY_DN67517_c2_g2~~TRINITY_DN67517_c2_g2_i1.p1  ORF type:complete len:123 (-),score=0.58 TRINITY_DN67517_c2_g2_i1:210-578(-)
MRITRCMYQSPVVREVEETTTGFSADFFGVFFELVLDCWKIPRVCIEMPHQKLYSCVVGDTDLGANNVMLQGRVWVQGTVGPRDCGCACHQPFLLTKSLSKCMRWNLMRSGTACMDNVWLWR